MVVQNCYQITYLEETLRVQTSKLSAQSRGRVDAAIAFLRHCNEFREQIWSLEEFKTLWRALFISYAPELRKRGDPCIVRRRRLCDVDGPVLLAYRVSRKASVYGLERPKKQQRITSPTLAPDALFGVMFSIDTAPRSCTRAELVALAPLEPGLYEAALEGSEPPMSKLSMESVQYGGAVHYCLCEAAESSGECEAAESSGEATRGVTWAELVLSDLTEDPEFKSQAWPAADFALIWSWVQRALAAASSARVEATFQADARTSAGTDSRVLQMFFIVC